MKARIAIIGMYFGWFCAICAVSLGLGYAAVKLVGPSTVVAVHTNHKLMTSRVPVNGILEYSVDVDRLQGCPSDVVDTWRSLDGPPDYHIVTRRRAALTVVRKYPGLYFRVAIPGALTLGRWRLVSVLESRCPPGIEIQSDLIAQFDIEVYAP